MPVQYRRIVSADINREGEIRGHYEPYMYIIQQRFASDKALCRAKIARHVLPGVLLLYSHHATLAVLPAPRIAPGHGVPHGIWCWQGDKLEAGV